MPQPANSVACEPSTRPHRSATIISPSPSAPSQPTGPAYQPRSNASCSAMSPSATSRGVPPTAGVGCSRPASASSPASSRVRAGDRRLEVLEVAQRQDRPAHRRRAASRRSAPRLARSMSTTTACSSRSFSLASSAAANRASSAGSPPRGADPAMATVSNDRPSVRTSRSGVAPRKVVPFRVKAKVVLSGAVRARCRSAATTSRSAVARRTTRRASTTLSIRPRPTAPANRPTVRSQSGTIGPLLDRPERAGRAPGAVAGVARGGRAACPVLGRAGERLPRRLHLARLGIVRSIRGERHGQRRGRPVPGHAERREHQRRGPERRPRIPGLGLHAAEPETAEQDRAAVAVTVVRCAVQANGIGQHLAPGVRRLGEAVRVRRPRPPRHARSPTIDRSAAGWSQSAASRSSAAGGREQVDRIERGDGQRGRAEAPRTGPPGRGQQRGHGRRDRDVAARGRPTVDDGHGVRAEWSAIRASGTPTLRSRSARSVG